MCIDYICNNFKAFLKKENLRKEDKTSGIHDLYTDVSSLIISSHDFISAEDFESSYSKVMAKYSRRIKRLYQRINDAHNILLVSSGKKYFEDDVLTNSLAQIKKTYPQKKFHLLYIQCDNQSGDDQKRELTSEVTLFNLHNLDVNDYDACCSSIGRLMKRYDICFMLKLKRMLPNLYFVIRKPILKLTERLPLGEKRKKKLRFLYKDKY